jgi:predicted Ser/Thr protein kinase
MNELGLDRAAAEALRTDAGRRRRFKAECWSLEVSGQQFVVKDYARTAWLFRRTLGRMQLRREERAYRALAGLPFVPRCFGRLDADALLIERSDGVPMTRQARPGMAPDFFARLDAAIAALHARGILHNDLRHRRNILVGPDGGPRLLDFASAIDVGAPGSWRRRLLGWLSFLDRSAAVKWALRHAPEQVPDHDRAWYRRYLWLRRLWPVRKLARNAAAAPDNVRPLRSDAPPAVPREGGPAWRTTLPGGNRRVGG